MSRSSSMHSRRRMPDRLGSDRSKTGQTACDKIWLVTQPRIWNHARKERLQCTAYALSVLALDHGPSVLCPLHRLLTAGLGWRLGWEPERRLGWEPERRLGWEPERRLGWEPERRLGWEPERRLGWEPERRLGREPERRLGWRDRKWRLGRDDDGYRRHERQGRLGGVRRLGWCDHKWRLGRDDDGYRRHERQGRLGRYERGHRWHERGHRWHDRRHRWPNRHRRQHTPAMR